MIEYLQTDGLIDFSSKNVLLVAAVDRFGLAEVFARVAKNVVYGDFMFAVGVPLPMRTYGQLKLAAALLLPVVCRLPFQWFYPTGKKQETTTPKYESYFAWVSAARLDCTGHSRPMCTTRPPGVCTTP